MNGPQWTGPVSPTAVADTEELLARSCALPDLIAWAIAAVDDAQIPGTYWITLPHRFHHH